MYAFSKEVKGKKWVGGNRDASSVGKRQRNTVLQHEAFTTFSLTGTTNPNNTSLGGINIFIKGITKPLYQIPLNVSGLSLAQISRLNPSEISHIQLYQVTTFTDSQLAYFTFDQLSSFTSEQITYIAADRISKLDDSKLSILIASFTPKQIQKITDSQISNLSVNQLSVILPSLTVIQLYNLLSTLTLVQIQFLVSDQIILLSFAQITSILSKLTPTQVKYLTNSHISSLNATQLSGTISYMNPIQIQYISNEQIPLLSNDDISKIIVSLSRDQIPSLTPIQISRLKLSEVYGLNIRQISALLVSQISAITPENIGILQTGQLSNLSTNQIAAFKNTQIAVLTEPQLKILSGDQITSINNTGLFINKLPNVSTDGITSITCQRYNSSGALYFCGNGYVRAYINGSTIIIAGNGTPGSSGNNGSATSALIGEVRGINFDKNDNIYITDYTYHVVRKINIATGIITIVCGTSGTSGYSPNVTIATSALLNGPRDLVFDSSDNMYISVRDAHVILKIDTNGNITTIVGNGQSNTSNSISSPLQLFMNRNTNYLYFVDGYNSRIQKIDLNTKIVTVVAGTGSQGRSNDGVSILSNFNSIRGFTFDLIGNLYISESYRIRKVDINNIVTTYAGKAIDSDTISGYGGLAISATIGQISYLCLDPLGNLIACDNTNSKLIIFSNINYIALSIDQLNYLSTPQISAFTPGQIKTLTTIQITKLIPSITPTQISALSPYQVSVLTRDQIQSLTFSQITALNLPGVVINSLITPVYSKNYCQVSDSYGNIYLGTSGLIQSYNSDIVNIVAGDNKYGFSTVSRLTSQSLYSPMGMDFDVQGNLYFVDYNAHVIRMINNNTRIITTIAGTNRTPGNSGTGGLATNALLRGPSDLAIDSNGDIYISVRDNHTINKISSGGIMTTIAGTAGTSGYTGNGGQSSNAKLNSPNQLFLNKTTRCLYFSETSNFVIRMINLVTGNITTVAGNGSNISSGDGGRALLAGFNNPYGITFDSIGNMYISEYYKIRMVDLRGVITTYAGTGDMGNTGDNGIATYATFKSLQYLKFDILGNLFVCDSGNKNYRKISNGYINPLSMTQLSYLTNDQIPYIVINSISSSQLLNLSQLQISKFSTAQIILLSTMQMTSVIGKLTIDQIPMITTRQIQRLTSIQIQSLTYIQIPVLTNEQIQAFTPNQIRAFTPNQIQNLILGQIRKLTISQIKSLTNNQISVITAVKFNQDQIDALSLYQRSALNNIITTDTYSYTDQIKSFLNSSSFSLNAGTYNMLVVGGGGGGGGGSIDSSQSGFNTITGGGGGAGGVIQKQVVLTTTNIVTIIVGWGGDYSTQESMGTNGSNTTVSFSVDYTNNILAYGGGFGGFGGGNSGNGGSGGGRGGGSGTNPSGTGTPSQGTDGGTQLNAYSGSGGGGSGGNTSNSSGGSGVKCSISNINNTYPNYYWGGGGAGGGGSINGNGGTSYSGGLGGGGNSGGGTNIKNDISTALNVGEVGYDFNDPNGYGGGGNGGLNTGGGGGGGGSSSIFTNNGGYGGSGIVVISK